MNINEVAKLAGISVRTLHYYDSVSLLKPMRSDDNGYRQYTESDLEKLQQILFFKECGFTISKIKFMLDSPEFDKAEAFKLQKKYLLHEKKRIETMLDTLEKTILSMKGEINMTQKEKFAGFDFGSNPYEQEAREKWGDEAVDKSKSHLNSMGEEGQKEMTEKMDSLFRELGKIKNLEPESEEVFKAMDEMFKFFNNNFGAAYSLEGFAGLGRMYVDDKRFTKNIDKYGEGLSEFLCKAMAHYCETAR